ncbi:MAG: DEAD/DEAH box helicase [Anaerolineales bacterium]|nr:DEAD/DEAH box helicase [Anaerolineales bacterium]
MSFDSFNLNPRIAAGVQAFGYSQPTPIQEKAIPPILEGRDVMGLAMTGTGKTAAFALPILQRLLEGPRGRIRALVLAPTRELAEQINDQFEGLGKQTRSRSVTLYGGVSQRPQVEKLRAGVEIAVACPGRLLDLIGQREIDLSHVEVLVLDEADRMMDMGFLPEVRRILKHVPAKRQTLFFSATMPDDIRKLSQEMLHQPVTVQIGQSAPATTVAHALYPVPSHLKTEFLRALLEQTDTDSVLVFTRTKHRAKRLADQLKKAGYNTACIQGNLSQNRRQAALDDFRAGRVQILVATDIAARGIDVTTISHVINYDMPDTAEAYTHRIGRTGRMTKTGDAFTLTTDEDTDMIRAIERLLGTRLERRTLPSFDYKAPAAERQPGQDRPPQPRGGRAGQTSRRAPAAPASAAKPAASPAAASAASTTPSPDAWTALRRKDRRRRPDFNHPSGPRR